MEFPFLNEELDHLKNHKYDPSAFDLAQTFPEAKARIVEILTELEELKKEMEQVIFLHCGKENEEFASAVVDIVFCEKERREKLEKVLKFGAFNGRSPKGLITPALVERARAVPIDTLIEFRNKVARCVFGHTDKSPSLYFYYKQNKAHCFGVCGKSYDSIDVYMHLHNCDFKTAVKELSK